MNNGKYGFSQLVDLVVRYQFQQQVARYQGDKHVKSFTCWEQFLALVFGQLTFRKSLRDIVVCLNAHQNKLYHLGFRSAVHLPTLAKANERRDWQIYRDFAVLLIAEARKLYAETELETLDISDAVYVIDSTTIELCLNLFPWAQYATKQAAVKLHLGLELHGNIPAFFAFSSVKMADVKFLDQVEYEAGAYYVFDRGYLDFRRFFAINKADAFFITRAKISWSFRRLYSRPTKENTGVCCDQIVVERNHHNGTKYPAKMRRVKYYDALNKHYYVFVTNNFELPAETIAELYKQRWQVELFFKWLKQHLAIEVFWGRSANAVKTQICVAIAAYLLVIIWKKRQHVERNTYEILQIFSVSLLEKIPLTKLIFQREIRNDSETNEKLALLWGKQTRH